MVSRRIVIVGGGFAGAALAYHLLQQRSRQLQVCMIEPGPRLGRGVAYGVSSPLLRLNVPASRMSLDPARPDDFVVYAGAQAQPHAYLSRALYGAYVNERLLAAAAQSGDRLQVLRAAAVDMRFEPAPVVLLEDCRALPADQVVLATGLSARAPELDLPRDPRIVHAWDESALAQLPREARVLVLGSGLSALDVLQLLDARAHRGQIVVMSRHGLLPREHAPAPSGFGIPASLLPPPSTLAALIPWLRRVTDAAQEAGGAWQHGIDALRPWTQQIWQSLSLADRRRFLRRVRPYWEVNRHRAPRDTLQRLREKQESGAVQLVAGRLLACDAEPEALRVRVRSREHGEREERFAALVCCLGPNASVEHAPPLIRSLVRTGHASADELGLGIKTGPLGRVIDAEGRASAQLFTLGQLCCASRWETTSAPDIVEDVVALAEWLGQ